MVGGADRLVEMSSHVTPTSPVHHPPAHPASRDQPRQPQFGQMLRDRRAPPHPWEAELQAAAARGATHGPWAHRRDPRRPGRRHDGHVRRIRVERHDKQAFRPRPSTATPTTRGCVWSPAAATSTAGNAATWTTSSSTPQRPH